MKFFASLSILAVCTMLLTACPISTGYPLGKKGEIKLNQDLLGLWVSSTPDIEASAIQITKGAEINTYQFEVIEKGTMFMADGPSFTAWITEIDSYSFMVLQQLIDGNPTEVYYVYEYKVDKKRLTSHDITLKVNGVDAITSIDSYREEVKLSMAFDDFLANPIDWVKK